MKTSKELREEAAAKLEEAHAIAKRAEDEGRDFTPDEKTRVRTLVDEGRKAKAAADDAAGQEDLNEQMRNLGRRLGGGIGTAGAGPSRWASDVAGKVAQPHGAKAVLTSGSVVVPTPLVGDIVRQGERPEWVWQLIPRTPVDGDLYRFMRQTVRTLVAAPTAEGGTKPTSTVTAESVDDRCRTLAHISEAVARQKIDDAALLGQFIDAELRHGLLLALDAQIITGNATGENMRGILNTSGIQVQAFATDEITTCRFAVTKMELAHIVPTAWVLHPNDWQFLELTREGANGSFLLGGSGAGSDRVIPVDRSKRLLWGIPVVVTDAIAEGTGLLGDFTGSARLMVREDTRVDVSENVADDFAKNLVRFRCEARMNLACTRPAGFVQVTLAIGS
jgi:HK97 family phage major capsid protein